MNDFIHAAAFAQHHHPTSQRSLQHLRSYSSSVNSTGTLQRPPARPVSKSISNPALETVAAGSNAPASFAARRYDEDGDMSTLPDPRSRSGTPANEISLSAQHPNLSNEVATLSNKLINAINYQTSLDDTLSATRHELEAARERVWQLERENKEHADLVARGVLIKKSEADSEKAVLSVTLAEERKQRREIEKEKKDIEQELENLTTALFEEANKMVITARESAQKDHDAVQKRNDQLKAQLADTESLLKSHQDQLAELKQVVEQLTEQRDDQTNPTAPSTPGLSKFDSKEDQTQNSDTTQAASIPETITPTYPTSLTHLLHTVLRTDLSSYDEFTSLLRMSKNIPVGSRASSGSYGSIGLGLGLGGYAAGQHQTSMNGSTSSLSTSGTHGSTPVTPTTPASTTSAASNNGPNSLTPLKETKFYKRALAEDIEPTLRLDSAPGLSWLARRTVLNAVSEGSLVVEPMPTSTKQFAFACSLCGETRKDTAHTRTHRFRTSENENAQRYPLCRYCLGRVRSSCDFLGFLRILKDGHWKSDDAESEKAAWEESVRLREQMFWCRMGGGVVPAHHTHTDHSPRMSQDERKEQESKLSEELVRTGEIRPRDVTPVPEPYVDASKAGTASERSSAAVLRDDAVGKTENAPEENATSPAETPPESVVVVEPASEINDHESSTEKRDTNRDSTQSTASLQVDSPGEGVKEEGKRLSITIPGSFD